MIFDPLYLLLLLPALLLAIAAQISVSRAYAAGKARSAASGLSGAEAARQILNSEGLHNVDIEETPGRLSDHYDPRDKVLRLSPEVYHGRTVAALGIAAHEAGHALQDAQRYPLLVMRNAIVPAASLGSSLSWILFFIGFVFQLSGLMLAGIVLFAAVVVFQLVNLPVEFDASSRAKRILFSQGMIKDSERSLVARILWAAAMTYVAATLTAILTLLYFLIRSGLLGGRR